MVGVELLRDAATAFERRRGEALWERGWRQGRVGTRRFRWAWGVGAAYF